MALLPVDDARRLILKGVKVLPAEDMALAEACGRILARDVRAVRDQPPFAASAMDGYAVRVADVADVPAQLAVIGMSSAGHGFAGKLQPGQAVRIFTGAPLPKGADAIVIQENTEAAAASVHVLKPAHDGQHVRVKGLDFARGEVLLKQGQKLTPRMIGLAAAMNVPVLSVRRRPRVAILATGDELVLPGGKPRVDQITSSNSFALAAMLRQFGAEPLDLGIVRDDLKATTRAIAKAASADVLITTGGASVGDHDFVQEALKRAGVTIGFWKIAMRPGKPLMFGRRGRQRLLGLPGNPVSCLVCARLFLKPLVDSLLGFDASESLVEARLGGAMKENDLRQDYVRSRLERKPDGTLLATPYAKQDSSMQRLMAEAECLIIRAPLAPAAQAGETVKILPLDF